MNMLRRVTFLIGIILAVVLLSGGCAYMKDRGSDALDIFDVGITFTKRPHVGVYAGFQSLLAVGYSDIDEGYMIGLGQGQAGWLKMRYNAGGAFVEGVEDYAYNTETMPDADPRGVGLGMIQHRTPKTVTEALQCPKFVHVLFIGANLNCKIGELVDFLVGWTTLDIGRDDHHRAATREARVTAQ